MVKLLPELTALFVFVDTPTDEKPPVLLLAAGTEAVDPPKEKPLAAGVGAGAGVELFPDAAAGAPNEKPPVAGAEAPVDGAGAGVDAPPNEKTITKSQ